MVNGIIRLHDGENVKEIMIEECDLFLGLGIVKGSEDDEGICVGSQGMCVGGKGLDSKIVAESLAAFVVKGLERTNDTPEQKKLRHAGSRRPSTRSLRPVWARMYPVRRNRLESQSFTVKAAWRKPCGSLGSWCWGRRGAGDEV